MKVEFLGLTGLLITYFHESLLFFGGGGLKNFSGFHRRYIAPVAVRFHCECLALPVLELFGTTFAIRLGGEFTGW